MARVKCPRCEFVNPEGEAACIQCGADLPKVRVSQAPGRTSAAPAAPVPQARQATLFRRGQQVAGRYTVVDIIGRGGMGCIYRVRDNVLGEDVALKTLLPQFVENKVVVERFFNEARIARHLSHPNIIRIHDIGQSGSVVYISMELLKGQSLRGLIDALPPGKHVPLDTALRVIDELCAALEYAHQHTVHRDIKPENIMILENGAVKLMDFGISKLMANMQLTAASMVMGTPMYMSPEQLKNSRDVDARADVFSVGVVLYETLTGVVPTGVPKPPSQVRRDVPEALDEVVAKCVEPDRSRRYQNATELRDALRPLRVLSTPGEPLTRLSTPPGKKPGPPDPSKRRALGVVLCALICVVAGFGLWGLEKNPSSRTQPDASPAASPVAATPLPAASLDGVQALAGRIRQRALAAIGSEETRREALAAGDALRAKEPVTLEDLAGALQCYLAILDWPEEMVFIPPGTVTLRDATGESNVFLRGFFIDATEVTVGDYALFCEEAGWRKPSYMTPAFDLEGHRECPATLVAFYDAQAYAAHYGKRLPTEAQWARAAYGYPDASDRFPWGDTWEPGACNVQSPENTYQGPAPVRSFPEDKNAYGCYDLAGNVMEWTRSLYANLPYDPDDGREDPENLFFGVEVALRGAHYGMAAAPLGKRHSAPFSACYPFLGFRCVKPIPIRIDALEKQFPE